MQPDEAADLPVVYFNNVTGVPIKAAISFAVDMNVYLDAGLIDTNTQQVSSVAIKWAGAILPRKVSNCSKTLPVPASSPTFTPLMAKSPAIAWITKPSSGHQFQHGYMGIRRQQVSYFHRHKPKNAAGYHQVNVGPVYFDGLAPGSFLNEETVVTFRVDMNNAETLSGEPFNPTTDTVALNGAFLPGSWQPWESLVDTQAFDDGVSGGDTTAGDGIYTVKVMLPPGTPARLVYKYGINGADNEAAVGDDRVRYVRSTGPIHCPSISSAP